MSKYMTLNMNGFNGVTKDKKSIDDRFIKLSQLKELVDKEIRHEDDIITLQEVPYKVWDKERFIWREDPVHNKFKEIFCEYKILFPKELVNAKQCTVAICKKDSLWENQPEDILKYNGNDYKNKFVELKCGDISLLGVHMPTDKKKWDLLIESLKDAPYTYVIGDFNANERRGEMRDMPERIRNCGYIPQIENKEITFYPGGSSIDNIYVKSKGDNTVKVIKTDLTDHALCILEYECDINN